MSASGRCTIRRLARAFSSVSMLLVACQTLTPEERTRNEVLWQAGRACEGGGVILRNIDAEGRISLEYAGPVGEAKTFMECYEKEAEARLRACGASCAPPRATGGTRWQ